MVGLKYTLEDNYSEPVKVFVDGQMNQYFSDQYNVLLRFMVTVMLSQPVFRT